FLRNLDRLVRTFEKVPDAAVICRNAADFRAARDAGRHAVFIGVQGGNALDEPAALASFDASLLLKVTLLHLSSSALGATSAPGGGRAGLTPRGQDLVRALDERHIFVDLAHINRAGFFDAVAVHDRSLPLLVSHTGIAGVHQHWRNV